MDELLQKALQKRDELRAALEALDHFIRSYPLTGVSPQAAAQKPSHPDLFTDPVVKRVSRSDRADALRAALDDAERMILADGAPLTRSQLVERLEAAGHHLEGADKSKVLGTNIWRSGRFFNLKGEGYWPRSAPLPEKFQALEVRSGLR